MSSLTYYLPAIIVIAAIVVAAIWFIFFMRSMIREKKGKSTCTKCKAAVSKTTRYPYLFLLPIAFGDTYSDAENYLRRNMTPIMNKEQIPTGRRACKVEVFDCPRCGNRQIEITDFLQVRGEDYEKGSYIFSYESFRHVFAAWEDCAHVRR